MFDTPVFQNIDDRSTLEIHNYRAVAPRLAPAPVIKANNPWRWGGICGRALVPMVNSGVEAIDAVSSAKYPPAGKRGSGAWRASSYYQKDAEYRKDANSSVGVVVQIETREALNNLDDIASTPGVDALFIGPADLALSLGMEPGELTPELLDACQAVAAAANKYGIASGIDVASLDHLLRFQKFGLSLFTYGSDPSFVLEAAAL